MNDADDKEAAEPADAAATEPDVTASVSSASVSEARLARLLQALLWVGNQDIARALRTMAPAEVMVVDKLPVLGSGKADLVSVARLVTGRQPVAA